MNTGFLGPAVATVLTVYGIETDKSSPSYFTANLLQQYLPFTVLKPFKIFRRNFKFNALLQQYLPFTVLKPNNVPQSTDKSNSKLQQYLPFTVLKHRNYNTQTKWIWSCNSTYRSRYWNTIWAISLACSFTKQLQQHLFFTIYNENTHKSLVTACMSENLN